LLLREKARSWKEGSFCLLIPPKERRRAAMIINHNHQTARGDELSAREQKPKRIEQELVRRLVVHAMQLTAAEAEKWKAGATNDADHRECWEAEAETASTELFIDRLALFQLRHGGDQ
jgi:hypothetical protein